MVKPGNFRRNFPLPEFGDTEDSHQLIGLGRRSKIGSGPQMLCLAYTVLFKVLNELPTFKSWKISYVNLDLWLLLKKNQVWRYLATG